MVSRYTPGILTARGPSLRMCDIAFYNEAERPGSSWRVNCKTLHDFNIVQGDSVSHTSADESRCCSSLYVITVRGMEISDVRFTSNGLT